MSFKKKETEATTKKPRSAKSVKLSKNEEKLELVEEAISNTEADILKLVNGEETTTETTIEPVNEEVVKDVDKLAEMENEIVNDQARFNELINNANDSRAIEAAINEEIENAKKIAKDAEKIIKRNTKLTNSEITYFWNGISYGE